MFVSEQMGALVPISGMDPQAGAWDHHAFLPSPLPLSSPDLSVPTYLAVANARAALASLDSTARRLPDPTLLRRPALRREAQSTSALEGTFAALRDVLTADEDAPTPPDLKEILNYVRMAHHAFAWVADGRPLTVALLCDLQRVLVAGTPLARPTSGQVRDGQVALQELVGWMQTDFSREIDPVVAAAMAHYQFETLHPFHDGNGRIGRLLVSVHLLIGKVLSEPTLTVSPWFETRRAEYYERLLQVSTRGRWDEFVRFFADGLHASADLTQRQMVALVDVQGKLKERVRASRLRADSALQLVDHALANPSSRSAPWSTP